MISALFNAFAAKVSDWLKTNAISRQFSVHEKVLTRSPGQAFSKGDNIPQTGSVSGLGLPHQRTSYTRFSTARIEKVSLWSRFVGFFVWLNTRLPIINPNTPGRRA